MDLPKTGSYILPSRTLSVASVLKVSSLSINVISVVVSEIVSKRESEVGITPELGSLSEVHDPNEVNSKNIPIKNCNGLLIKKVSAKLTKSLADSYIFLNFICFSFKRELNLQSVHCKGSTLGQQNLHQD